MSEILYDVSTASFLHWALGGRLVVMGDSHLFFFSDSAVYRILTDSMSRGPSAAPEFLVCNLKFFLYAVVYCC